jgi:hypothetical protein
MSCMPLRASDSVRFESMRGKVFSESQRNRLLCAEGRSGINPRRLSAVAAVANHQKTTQNRTFIVLISTSDSRTLMRCQNPNDCYATHSLGRPTKNSLGASQAGD